MNNFKHVLRTLNVFGYDSGDGMRQLEESFTKLYGENEYFVFKNGRYAIYSFLKSLNLEKGSNVFVQAFTCNAVITPILALGLVPIYVDIDADTFNMSLEDLKTKAKYGGNVAILQHTFGIKVTKEVFEFCKENDILTLEDCAHTLGDTNIGFDGDVSMFSFGIEKLLPTRVGGMLMVNNRKLISNLQKEYLEIEKMSKFETFQWMINPILWRVLRVLPVKGFFKYLLKKMKLLIGGFSSSELFGDTSSFTSKALSSVLAKEVSECLSDIKPNVASRKEVVDIYVNNLDQKYVNSLLRYPYVAKSKDHKDKINQLLQKYGIPTTDAWFSPVIFPRGTDLENMKYVLGSCKVAEDVSSRIINLPTGSWVSKEIAINICKDINDCN